MSDRPVDDNTVLAIPSHVLTRRTSGETVLLSLESEEYYGLENVGDRLWELIENQQSDMTFADMVAIIANEFNADPTTVAADLSQLISDLLEANLVVARTAH